MSLSCLLVLYLLLFVELMSDVMAADQLSLSQTCFSELRWSLLSLLLETVASQHCPKQLSLSPLASTEPAGGIVCLPGSQFQEKKVLCSLASTIVFCRAEKSWLHFSCSTHTFPVLCHIRSHVMLRTNVGCGPVPAQHILWVTCGND